MDIVCKQKVWLALSNIPKGNVVTYGQLAELAGMPRTYARVVGNLLSQLPNGSDLPWHRVVSHNGTLSFPQASSRYHEQRSRLIKEGIKFNGDKIILPTYRWTGPIQ